RRRARGATCWSGTGRSRDAQQQRVPLTAAAAQGRGAQAAAPAAQLVDEVQRDAGPRGADGVAKGDGPAVDVHPVLIDAQVADGLDGDRRERLVDLDQVEVGNAEPGPAQGL